MNVDQFTRDFLRAIIAHQRGKQHNPPTPRGPHLIQGLKNHARNEIILAGILETSPEFNEKVQANTVKYAKRYLEVYSEASDEAMKAVGSCGQTGYEHKQEIEEYLKEIESTNQIHPVASSSSTVASGDSIASTAITTSSSSPATTGVSAVVCDTVKSTKRTYKENADDTEIVTADVKRQRQTDSESN